MLRVLPRDAFNDANLLKCIGKLTLLIEEEHLPGLHYDYDGEQQFRIEQDPGDGSTFVANIFFFDNEGEHVQLYRPINSRENWPLRMIYKDSEYYVFNEDGDIMFDRNKFLSSSTAA